MKTLILNVGSATIKYSVFENKKLLKEGMEERVIDFEKSFRKISGKIDRDIKTIVHRVVHGGNFESRVIDRKLMSELKKFSELAPVHQANEIKIIELCGKIFPKARQIAVFDTAFHKTIPEKAAVYGIPYKFYKKGVRAYGFHGISCSSIAKKLKKSKIIICHFGNGCSVTAVKNGRSIDNSMGFTPLGGTVMGSRCGSIDPSIIFYMMKHQKMKIEEVYEMLNSKSGLLGISGISNDIRDILKSKSKKARLALDVFCYNAAKWIGAYAAVLDGVSAIVFTGGIGENNPEVRKKILEYFSHLGLKIDNEKNKRNERIISSNSSKVTVYIIPCDETREMLEEAETLGNHVSGARKSEFPAQEIAKQFLCAPKTREFSSVV